MKRSLYLLLSLLLISLPFSGCDVAQQAASAVINSQGQPTTLEITSALKQALEQGSTNGTNQLSAVDGFFANAAIKILFPPEARKAESTLRSIGLGKLADNVILSLNRAAEDAAKQAKPIFVNAVKQMTLQDVTGILLGSQDAATQYFKRTTKPDLLSKFAPVIQASISKVGATRYYSDAVNAYNKIPLVTKLNPDIADYVTQKAIDGVFYQIAQEELKIRQNIGFRTTPLMQKVFAYADRTKNSR
ncbi:DUF4197 domain-containing protein [Mucilaginibacter calamicampi]|uniref:DUF4197 domain-containing protein n=1 Tax=Mucilaginibacter calamicampi TaxID=1302352 RepID=A0ABW2YXA5_9SPHI